MPVTDAERGSILLSVRDSLGIVTNDDSFDGEILIHINAALATLYQAGVGTAFSITGIDDTWDDFLNDNQVEGNEYRELIKQYLFVKTKILFDPPTASTLNVFVDVSNELIWRLEVAYSKYHKAGD